jgi:hypothetical protein
LARAGSSTSTKRLKSILEQDRLCISNPGDRKVSFTTERSVAEYWACLNLVIVNAILLVKAAKSPVFNEKGGIVDPITTAILAVLRTIGSEVVKSGVKDAYEGLKAVIRRKWGDTAPISKAISAIEEDPESTASLER